MLGVQRRIREGKKQQFWQLDSEARFDFGQLGFGLDLELNS